MSELSGSGRRKLEKLLGIGGGYVLNFSDRTFGDFFDEYRVEVDAERYLVRGASKAIREAIEKNQPEGGLDRLHTFVNKFIRVTCVSHGVTITRDKPLHSVFGEYVKALPNGGHLESAMTERIRNPVSRCWKLSTMYGTTRA